MSKAQQLIERYNARERMNHWIVSLTFILLALSGLAFFHPAMFWLAAVLGGGAWARILHPFIGVVMALSFALLALRLWHHNRLNDNDREWLKRWREVVNNREEGLPEVGRYNGGQKWLFQLMVVSMAVLAVSGVLMWRPYFAGAFPIGLVRLGSLLHAVAAFALILGLVVHVYAAIWIKGTVRAMTRGTVTAAWAKKHHPGWYKEVAK